MENANFNHMARLVEEMIQKIKVHTIIILMVHQLKDLLHLTVIIPVELDCIAKVTEYVVVEMVDQVDIRKKKKHYLIMHVQSLLVQLIGNVMYRQIIVIKIKVYHLVMHVINKYYQIMRKGMCTKNAT